MIGSTRLRLDELDAALHALHDLRSVFNPLILLRREAKEETQSRVLSWLLDPRENHAMGTAFALALFRRIYPTELIALTENARVTAELRTNDGRIDVLLLDRSSGLVVIIELKTFSAEHDHQLTRYRAWCDRRFRVGEAWLPHRRIYLTREGALPETVSEQQHWTSVSYRLLLDAIDDVSMLTSADVRQFIDWYALAVRRRLLRTDDVARQARRIAAAYSGELARVSAVSKDDSDDIIQLIKAAVERDDRLKMRGDREREYSPKNWPESSVEGPGTLKFRFAIDLYADVKIQLIAQSNGAADFTNDLVHSVSHLVPGDRKPGAIWIAWEQQFLRELAPLFDDGVLAVRFDDAWQELMRPGGAYQQIVKDVENSGALDRAID